MGFKDPASAHYLGYQEHGLLFCRHPHHRNNEYICPRMRPEGDWVLLVRRGEYLLPLGIVENDGTKPKIQISEWTAAGIFWDFIEVHSEE